MKIKTAPQPCYEKVTHFDFHGFVSPDENFGVMCFDRWDNFRNILWFSTEAERDEEFNRLTWEV